MAYAVRSAEDDWGVGVDDGANPKLLVRKWLDINWQFPTQYNSNIQGFEVLAYTGANPSDASSWLFQPKAAAPTDRRMVIAVSPNADLASVKAAVRAIYV